ncbi:MAG: hypothetical protein WEB60_09580 [Terrimicrobiaceae bacterium]
MEKEELIRQIGVLAEMGMGGFFMHASTGLATEYLGREWMALVAACTAEAKRRGLESWLYDEDRWPSGAAGGLATKLEKYRMRYLRGEILTKKQASGRTFRSPVARFAIRNDDLHLASYRKLSPQDFLLHPGEKLMIFAREIVQPHSFFNGGTYLNTLDKTAVGEFLRLTHEQYQKFCGQEFGATIPGIFTDEPHHGFVMCETPAGWLYPPDSGWVTPWADDFAELFEAGFGYDLCDRLPELFLRLHGERLSPVKWQYMELLHRRFLDCWARPILEWCRRHHLRNTGHLLAEDLPGDQSITCGSVLRYYEFMESPGMDQLLLGNRSFWMAKQVASSARQFGRREMLSELYGVTGWQLDFDGHKAIGDWQSFLGINLRCHHLSWYSMAGEAKRDFPASIFFQSAWYREYRMVEDYFARVHLLMQQGRAECDILVLHPVESVWAQVHAKWATFIKNQSLELAPIDRTFASIFRWIIGAQLDFDYGDEEQLHRLGVIKSSKTNPTIHLGEAGYQVVVVAGLNTMRASTLALLERFLNVGGKVIFAGAPPSHVDAMKSSAPTRLSKKAIRVPLNNQRMTRILHAAAPPKIRLTFREKQKHDLPLILQTRLDGNTWVIAICNTDPARTFPVVGVHFDGSAKQVQEWDCRTGKCYGVPTQTRGGQTHWKTSLTKSGERIFRVVAVANKSLQPRPKVRTGKTTPLHGPFEYALDEPNVLVLDRFLWRTGREPWQEEADILAIDTALRNRLKLPQRGHGMMQPWARPARSDDHSRPVTLRCTINVRQLPQGPVHLLMEQPDRWTVKLNDQFLATANDSGWFVDPCFRKIPLPEDGLREGQNQVELSANFMEGLDLEAIYLLGEFGVYRNRGADNVLSRPPAQLRVGDVCGQGFPHYTGRIRYRLVLPTSSKRQRRLGFPAFGGAVICIDHPEAKTQEILPFHPHETLLAGGITEIGCRVILTRRNLFGPLHLLPKKQNAITPASFRTAGRNYALRPQLYPSGLLAPPEIC